MKTKFFKIGFRVSIVVLLVAWFASNLPDKILQNVEDPFDAEMPATPVNLPLSSSDVQYVGGQGSGIDCSIPWPFNHIFFSRNEHEAPIGLHMRQVCAAHDFCYRHGAATYGYSQTDCDQLLQVRAFRLCRIIRLSVSVEECESEARRITLALILKGYGSFKQPVTGPEEIENVSSYFEFEPFPIRSARYAAVRVADTPRALMKAGRGKCLPKSLYIFDIRPSGVRLNILCWFASTAYSTPDIKICLRLPGSHIAINTPPIVVRDGTGTQSQDWFVWWRRAALRTSLGNFAYIPPGKASFEDWHRVLRAEDCGDEVDHPGALLSRGAGRTQFGGTAELPRARVHLPVINYGDPGDEPEFRKGRITAWPKIREGEPIDLGIVQFFSVPDTKADNTLLLMSLTKGGDCNKALSKVEASPCTALLKLNADTGTSELLLRPLELNCKWKKERREEREISGIRDEYCSSYRLLRPLELNCKWKKTDKKKVMSRDEFCGSYRNFASQPFPVFDGIGPRLVVLKRGTGKRGANYQMSVQVRTAAAAMDQFATGPIHFAVTEKQEPLSLLDRVRSNPWFLSLRLEGNGNVKRLRVVTWRFPDRTAWKLSDTGRSQSPNKGYLAETETVQSQPAGTCGGIDQTWLKRPVAVLGGRGVAHLLFTRTKSLTRVPTEPLRERPTSIDIAYKIEGRLARVSPGKPCILLKSDFEGKNSLALRTSQMRGKCVGTIWQRNGKCRKERRTFWRRFLSTIVPADLDGDGKLNDLIVPDLFCPECSELRHNILPIDRPSIASSE